MAIAPTATISNIAGSVPAIEPIYKNIYVKSNISGDFIIVNSYLVKDLKKLGLWSQEMLDKIKYYDGSIQAIAEIPFNLKNKYRETFEIDMRWLIRTAASRGKWIDQSQSLNIFFAGTSGKELSDLYLYAWEMGLKTTYYLRSLGASQVEKSTIDAKGTQMRKSTDNQVVGTDATATSHPTPSPLTSESLREMVTEKVASVPEVTPIPSPIATPSPMNKASVEAGMMTAAPQVEKKVYNLHVAEEALCEACQ